MRAPVLAAILVFLGGRLPAQQDAVGRQSGSGLSLQIPQPPPPPPARTAKGRELYDHGVQLCAKGEFEQAVAWFKLAGAAFWENQAEAWTGVVENCLRQVRLVTEGKLGREEATAFFWATQLRNDRQLQRAIQEYEHASKLNPKYAEVHEAIGRTYGELKQWDLALEHLRLAKELGAGVSTEEITVAEQRTPAFQQRKGEDLKALAGPLLKARLFGGVRLTEGEQRQLGEALRGMDLGSVRNILGQPSAEMSLPPLLEVMVYQNITGEAKDPLEPGSCSPPHLLIYYRLDEELVRSVSWRCAYAVQTGVGLFPSEYPRGKQPIQAFIGAVGTSAEGRPAL